MQISANDDDDDCLCGDDVLHGHDALVSSGLPAFYADALYSL